MYVHVSLEVNEALVRLAVMYGPRGEDSAAFGRDPSESLEDNEGFPKAFFAFLNYLFEHRCERLRHALHAPVQKPERASRK